MTTKPPPPVLSAPADSREQLAYGSVAGIPVADSHDRDRLGYNVWRWIMFRKDPLEIALASAGARLQISQREAVSRVREYLRSHGMTDVD